MKRFLTALMAASAIFALNSCTEDTPGEELNGPSIEWESNSDFSTVDITETMDVNLTIKAPAGIKSFTVDVNSDVLEKVLGAISSNGSTLDLINDTKLIDGLKSMAAQPGFEGLADMPTGDAILNQTSIDFNISSLVPLILLLTQNDTEESLHEFTINVTDNNAKTATETCTFRRVASDTPSYAAPTAEWVGHSFDEPMELSDNMEVKININAPAGFKEFTVNIESAPLNNGIELGPGVTFKLTELDLINPDETTSAIVSMILGTQDIKTATTLNLDLSSLVPMIIDLKPENNSDHKFTFNVVDNADQTLSETCTFHYTGETTPALSVDESSVDLWANTVKLNVSGEVTSVAYREKDTETWIEVKADDNGEYIVAPVWNEGQNEAGLTVYTPKAGTGIFAGKTYEFQLNGETVADAELVTNSGDVIQNGDMSQWSTTDDVEPLPYPNAEGDTFWTSGNNGATPELCVNDNGAAKLASVQAKAFGFFDVFAAGNLYTGTFKYSVPAEASFGQVYPWTARPKALKLRYKANVGPINWVTMTPEGAEIVEDQTIDKARIYVAVTEWSGLHTVATNPLTSTVTGTWDPETTNKVDEGAILGYASQYITESTSGDSFMELVIPFNWYDIDTKPADDRYSIVISCTASYLGDYLTGCSTNKLWVDDFEWVY